MPYISKEARSRILKPAGGRFIHASSPENAGELNFAFTTLIANYIQRKGLNYQIINDVIGALEGAKLELYRRQASPYEDIKMRENGDCYQIPEIKKDTEVKKEEVNRHGDHFVPTKFDGANTVVPIPGADRVDKFED